MWHIVQYNDDYKYGVIEAPSLNSIPTRLCRVHSNGLFGVHCLSSLTCVVLEDQDFDWTLAEWLTRAKVTILESFESNDPLTDLPNLFPEHYL